MVAKTIVVLAVLIMWAMAKPLEGVVLSLLLSTVVLIAALVGEGIMRNTVSLPQFQAAQAFLARYGTVTRADLDKVLAMLAGKREG